jgi:DNA-directed RNA polymerase specialized sigma subunit
VDDLKGNELEIFKKFKQTGDKKHFQELYSSMKPLIYKAADKAAYGSNIPQSAHRMYAAQAFLDSLKTFNPNSGASLSTHVYGSVQNKVKRLNYEYQDMGKKPENRAVMVGQFQNAFENLKADLGREPSSAELADHMSLPLKQVAHLQVELRKDLGMGAGTDEVAYSETSSEEEFVQYLYFELGAEEKVVYEYITGAYGKPKMGKKNGKIDYAGIAQRMGVSESKVRVLHNSIRSKLKKVLRK